MSADLVRFVDSLVASPTTRLDINDEVKWWVRSFNAPPPRLRRSVGQNAMRDGIFVSSSQYDARVVTIEIDLKTTTQDDNATELQKLARELDRADNFLMYQPTGATKPVFFRLYRSDMSQIEQLTGSSAFRRPTIELLAEPFALGLRETLGPFTVNNDPAAGSNGLFFDVTGVIGDVAAPMVAVFTNATSLERYGYLSVRQHGTPSNLGFAFQSELGLGTDTTNPGGGPDAAMSGTGTNNFSRCSFAGTPTMATRVNAALSSESVDVRGRYRILAVVRRSDASSAITMRLATKGSGSSTPGDTVTVPLTTNRQVINLGLFDNTASAPDRIGYGSTITGFELRALIQAARSSGAGTIDFDYVVALPADEAMQVWDLSTDSTAVIFDGHSGLVGLYESGADPFASTSWTIGFSLGPTTATGSLPSLVPNQTNRFYMVTTRASGVHDKSDTNVVNLHYWPRYLFVRPSAT